MRNRLGIVPRRAKRTPREFIAEETRESGKQSADGRVAYYTFLLFIGSREYRLRSVAAAAIYGGIYGGLELSLPNLVFFIGILIRTRLSSTRRDTRPTGRCRESINVDRPSRIRFSSRAAD